MKRKILFLMALCILVGCGEVNSSSSSSSQSSLIDSSSQSSTSTYVDVENIKISLVNENNYAGQEIKYKVEFYPENATNKDFIISTSTPDTLNVKDNVVEALYMGKAKLKVTSTEGSFSDEIEFDVLKPNPYEEIIDLLKLAKEQEKNFATGVTFSHNYTSSLLEQEHSYLGCIYNDGIYTNDLLNNKEEYKYISDNQYIEFIIDKNLSTLNESKTQIGASSNMLSQEEAEDKIKHFEFDGVYGLSNFTESKLMDINSFYMDDISINGEVIKESKDSSIEFSLTGECYYLASYLDEHDSKIELEGSIIFNNDNQLSSVHFSINKYLSKNDGTIDEDNPTSKEIYQYSLSYGNRTNMSLNVDQYYVNSFDLDLSTFKNESNNNIIHIEESKTINIINELPAIHFPEVYTLEIEDTSILKKGNSSLEVVGVSKGATNVKVISSKGVEKSFDVTVETPLVNKISLSYIPNFITEGETFEVKASCSPSSAEDKSYTIFIKDNSDLAKVELISDGTYLFTALSAGTVTIVATSNGNPDVIDEESIIIKALPNENNIKDLLCSKTYYGPDSELKFNSDNTGSLSLQGGGKYAFTWSLRIESTYVYIDFSNVTVVDQEDRWYKFVGQKGSYTNTDASFIYLIIYDLDWEENTSMQFS